MDLVRMKFGEPDHVGRKHQFYKVPGRPEMVVQRQSDLPDSAEWFEVACSIYELWQQTGAPVRFMHRYQGDDLDLAFVGREIERVRPKIAVSHRQVRTERRTEAVLLDETGELMLVPDIINGRVVQLDRTHRAEVGWMEWVDFKLTDRPIEPADDVRSQLAEMGQIAHEAFDALAGQLEKSGIQLGRMVLEFGLDVETGDLLIATSMDIDSFVGYSHDGELHLRSPEWPNALVAATAAVQAA